MTRLQDTGQRSRLATAARRDIAVAMLLMGNGPLVALAAEAEKAAADAPLTLKPGQDLPAGKWVDVMTPADPEWDTVNGAWHRGAWDGLSGTWRSQGSELTAERSCYQRLMLPVKLEGSYDLKVEFTRRSDNSSVDILFLLLQVELVCWPWHQKGNRNMCFASSTARVRPIATTPRFGGQVIL